jgi:Zn-dependent protease with chaperone function
VNTSKYEEVDMTFGRFTLIVVCMAAVMALIIGVPVEAQESAVPAAQSAPATSSGLSTQTNSQDAYSLPPDTLAKAIAIGRTRNFENLAGSVWGVLFLWILLATRGWLGIERWAHRISNRRWVQGMVFFAIYLVVSAMASFPLGWLVQHNERAYGISVQAWGSWMGDQGKSLALRLLFGVPLLLLFNWIVRKWPRRYWFASWLVTLPILLVVIFVSPLLSPIFDKFEPLQKNYPELVAQLEKVVARSGTNIPPDRMFLMKASLKTNGLSAYVNGIGATKRIVVWDTTAGRVPNDEVLFIFGHESGHYVLNHVQKYLAIYSVGLFFVYWACAVFATWMIKRFGASWGVNALQPTDNEPSVRPSALASRTGFVVLLFAISIVSFLLEPVGNSIGRHYEHQADVFGQEAIHGIVPNPQKTTVAVWEDDGKAWLEDPHPNQLIEFWLYSHPSIEKRANFAAHYDPWKNGGHGEFFKN